MDTALIGVRNVPEAVENCGGFDWTLTDEEAAAIDAAIEQYLNCLLYTSPSPRD